MALGWQGERQADLMVGWAELPHSPGHAFYDRLQAVLVAAGFDGFAEAQCALASGRRDRGGCRAAMIVPPFRMVACGGRRTGSMTLLTRGSSTWLGHRRSPRQACARP